MRVQRIGRLARKTQAAVRLALVAAKTPGEGAAALVGHFDA